MLRYTMLGSSASYAAAGQACSGHLLSSAETSIVLDLGMGALANLGRVIDPLQVDRFFISHTHPDHFADLYAMQAVLRFAPGGPAGRRTVYAPDGLLERMTCVLSSQGQADFVAAFGEETLEPGRTVGVGDISVTPKAVEHSGPSFAFVVGCGGATLCYTGDSKLSMPVYEAARGADVLVAEATMPKGYEGHAAHMTGGEAGRLAEECGVKLLVLSHLWPTADRESAAAEAREAFSGEVLVGEELLSFDVGEVKGR